MPTDCCPKCEALRRVEWIRSNLTYNEPAFCPWCMNYREQGHAEPCIITAALSAPCAVKLMREKAKALHLDILGGSPEAERVLRDIIEAVDATTRTPP